MSRAWDAELAEYALGNLPEEQRRELDAALLSSPELRAELRALREVFGLIAVQRPAVAPAQGGLGRLLRALDTSARYSPFVAQLMRLFDLPEGGVLQLLRQIDEASCWTQPLPGFRYMEFDTGPNAAAPHAGFSWLARGSHVPRHRHHGIEINFVLEGALRGDDGVLYTPGEAMVLASGSVHQFWIPDDADALFAVVHESFEFLFEQLL